MREIERIARIMNKLEELWRRAPDQRLGQLLENYVFEHHLDRKQCIFHIEDTVTELKLDLELARDD